MVKMRTGTLGHVVPRRGAQEMATTHECTGIHVLSTFLRRHKALDVVGVRERLHKLPPRQNPTCLLPLTRSVMSLGSAGASFSKHFVSDLLHRTKQMKNVFNANMAVMPSVLLLKIKQHRTSHVPS